MIEVKNLEKKYGDIYAVKNVSFTVNQGEVLGFLGPNGAGKSTTMNIITGYLSSTAGTVTIDGCEILEDPIGAKSKIGYLPEIPPLYVDMTVKKYLEFIFELKKVKLPKDEHIKEVCSLAKIEDASHRIIGHLSKGYRQRVGLAQALIGDPPVLIFDEPTVGLDPKQIIEMRSLIRGLGKKHTVILSSHVLSEVQATCDRVIIINKGEVIADSKAGLLEEVMTGRNKQLLQIVGNEVLVTNALKDINGVIKVEKVSSLANQCTEFIVTSEKDKDVRKDIFNAMAQKDFPIILMKNAGLSLEEAFLRLTSEGSLKGGKK